MYTVAIIGGGASGTLVAGHLARIAARTSEATECRIIIFEPRAELGQGVAYSTTDPLHLLNVRASNMSCAPADPTHFAAWSGLSPSSFASRVDYGRYLRDFLGESLREAEGRVHFHHRQWWVTSVKAEPTGGFTVHGDMDEVAHCDDLVLAIGHGSPNFPSWLTDSLAMDPRVIVDPWQPGALEGLHGATRVAIVGTGLTFVDLALTLERLEIRHVIGISRHGLLPQPHAAHGEHIAAPDPTTLHSPRAALRWIRSHGTSWREAFDAIRPLLPTIWGQWSLEQRQQFLRHAHRYWEIHRHRMPETSASRITELLRTGQVSLLAGAISQCNTSPTGLQIQLADGRTVDVEHLVLATGVSDTYRDHPVVASLMAQGLAVEGPLGMGLQVHPADGQLVPASDGPPHHSPLTIGSVRRGVSWESTAIPELRVQAHAVASLLHSRLMAASTPSVDRVA